MIMKAKTLYNLLKPHLDLMEPTEKKSLSNLINGVRERNFDSCDRKISVRKAKEKLTFFRQNAIEMSRK